MSDAQQTTAARERVTQALADLSFTERPARDGLLTVVVAREDLRGALEALKEAGFESNTFVTAVDRFPEEPRFEVLHQLLSIEHNDRVRVVTHVPGDDPRVPSGRDLWPGTSFSERECFDMFGIEFEGHGDLRRLLMPEAYDHFPLRKDFPHQGIEPDRLYREWDRKRREEEGSKA